MLSFDLNLVNIIMNILYFKKIILVIAILLIIKLFK